MSVNAVITRGYGSFGSIPLVVLRGYGQSSPVVPTVDTHDGAYYRKRLKKQQDIIEKRREEKLADAKNLRRLIEEAKNPPSFDEPNNETVEVESVKSQASSIDKTPELLNELAALEKQIKWLALEFDRLALEQRKMKDEEDIMIILEAITIH